MFCSNCGKKVEATDKFCVNCGTPQRSVASVQVESPYNKSKVPFSVFKKAVEHELTQTIINEIEKGSPDFTMDDASDVSTFILQHIDNTQTPQDIIDMMHKLVEQWPNFFMAGLTSAGLAKKNAEA
jgi:hypothetical protein